MPELMPHNKNTDRTRRRILRWIAVCGCLGVVIALYFPDLFSADITSQRAHDTAGDPFADSLDHELPPETIELPADTPELPLLIPPFLQDEELMTVLAAEYNLLTSAQMEKYQTRNADTTSAAEADEREPATPADISPDSTPPVLQDEATKSEERAAPSSRTTPPATALADHALPPQDTESPDDKEASDKEKDKPPAPASSLAHLGARDLTRAQPTVSLTDAASAAHKKTAGTPAATAQKNHEKETASARQERNGTLDIADNAVNHTQKDKTPPHAPSLAHLGARDLSHPQTVPPAADGANTDPQKTTTAPLQRHSAKDKTQTAPALPRLPSALDSLAHGKADTPSAAKAPPAVSPPPDKDTTNQAQNTAPPDTARRDSTARQTAPANSVTLTPSEDADKSGEFIKKHFVIRGSNIWAAIQKSDLNPYLKKQLEPLRRRLSQGNINRIQILYTDYVKNGSSKAENSKILLVDGMRGATLIWSFYAREKDRKMAFYDYDGNAPELAMDRVPLRYSHITSPFNPARRHPITGRIQAHTGVDLKAAYGAAVHSTGKGVVTFAGWQSGYGRIVIIRHDNDYETRYAHLAAIDVDAGQSVARGAVIGKVGNSGASTGTHLHYEVRIHGTPYDPMTVKIPSAQPLPANYMKAWQYRAEQYRLAMSELSGTVKK